MMAFSAMVVAAVFAAVLFADFEDGQQDRIGPAPGASAVALLGRTAAGRDEEQNEGEDETSHGRRGS